MDTRRFFFVLSLAAALVAGPGWAQPSAEMPKTPDSAKTSVPSPAQVTPAAPAAGSPTSVVSVPPPSSFIGKAVSVEEALSSLKADLKITDAQAKDWENFAASALNSQNAAKDAINSRPSGPAGIYDVLQSRQKYMKARADGLEKMAAAFKPLYDSLSDEQKAAADRIIPQRLGMVM